MPDGLDPDRFNVVEASTYSGINTTISTEIGGSANKAGLIYVSATDSTHGELWYDSDVSQIGGETKLLDITEYLGESEANYDLNYDAILALDLSGAGGAGAP